MEVPWKKNPSEMIPTHFELFQLKAQILDGFDWKENAQKSTKIAFFSQVNWHLQIFRHRIIFAQTWTEVLIEV